MMSGLRSDLRFAFRQLARAPGFTAVAILSLALGIAGTTVMFGAVSALLLRYPGGVDAPEEIARLFIVRNEGVIQTPDGGPGSYLDFRALQAGTQGVDGVAAFLPVQAYDYGLGVEAKRVRGRPVSGEFFSLLGVIPQRGRLLALADDRPAGADRVVVVSDGFWHRELGAEPAIVGRSMRLNGELFTIVGVADARFTGIDSEAVDIWTPLGTAAGGLIGRADAAHLEYLARIVRESDRRQVRASAQAALAASSGAHPELDPSPGVTLGSLNAARGPHPSGAVRLAVMLWLATAMLLLIACANVANLLLARATLRRRELAVRRALGAGGRRITRQLLTESLLLALMGGGVGLGLALLAGGLVQRFPEIPSGSGLDFRLVGFSLLASLATGLIFGLAPAIQRSRKHPVVALNESQPGAHPTSGRLSMVLVTAQVALAVVLLVGAGIFVRSLQKVAAIETGLDLDHLVLASVDLESAGYGPREAAAFYERGLARLRALPGVAAASVAMPLPLGGGGWGVVVRDRLGGEYVPVPEGPYAYTVGDDFFQTAGIRIVEGRSFDEEDRPGAEPAAVVSERLARALAPGGTAVGLCVPVGAEEAERGGCTRIVGVAADIRHRFLVDDPMPYVYRLDAQIPFTEAPSLFRPEILVRAEGAPEPLLGAVRAALQGLAPDLPYVEVQPLEIRVAARAVRPFRIAALVLALFGVLALVLAAVGLYGTLTHLVAHRASEVGVRMALGADRGQVVRLVIRRAMIPVAAGLVVGLAAAAAIARLIDAELNGLSPGDPVAPVVVIIVLVTAALAASWLPARRAANLDPMVTLRGE